MNVTNTIHLDRVEGTNTERVPKIGDVMLLEPRLMTEGAVTGNVSRVTKTQFRVTAADGKEYGPFKIAGRDLWVDLLANGELDTHDSTEPATRYYWQKFDVVGDKCGHAKYDSCTFNHEVVARQLAKQAETAKKMADEKKAAHEAQRLASEKRKAEELAEVKAAFGYAPEGNELPTSDRCSKETLLDGSRLYTICLPVAPAYVERKNGWERLIVRCKTVKTPDWDAVREVGGERPMKEEVECAYTYINGNSCSFASCSSSNHASDEDAVWDAARQQYHSW